MFTGIIERTLAVAAATDHAGGRRIVVPNPWPDAALGESIAVNGCCLTVADRGTGFQPVSDDGSAEQTRVENPCHDWIAFDVIRESLDKTNLGDLIVGDTVNLERALRVGGRLDGHFVQGHVDGVGVFVNKVATADEWRYTIEAPAAVAKYLSPKGSVCVDGVSLTIAAIDGNRFDVALIPTTLRLTTLADRETGYRFNLEADLIAKQIVTFLDARGAQLGV